MRKREEILFGLCCFLGGVVSGFLISPIKKGLYCGNNNGNVAATAEELEKMPKNAEKYKSEEK